MNILWVSFIVGLHTFALLGLIGLSSKAKVVTVGFTVTLDISVSFWVGLHLVGSIVLSMQPGEHQVRLQRLASRDVM